MDNTEKLSYYERNKNRHKAVSALYYLLNRNQQMEGSHDYYMKNSMKWKQYNLHNHNANAGTGLLGLHRNPNVEKEQELIGREMRRLGLR